MKPKGCWLIFKYYFSKNWRDPETTLFKITQDYKKRGMPHLPYPTPAVWPMNRALFIFCGPCLIAASWSALCILRPIQLMKPNWASMVLSTFPERKVVVRRGETRHPQLYELC